VTLFLDACALIYWMETAAPFYHRLLGAMREVYKRDPRAEIGVSRLSQLECLVKPLQTRDDGLQRRYRQYFSSPSLRIVELDAAIMEHAALLRATVKGLRTPDAIQAASALSLKDEVVFLTGDLRFDAVPGLKIVSV
jgi:predicted nucleic acid-binding protein